MSLYLFLLAFLRFFFFCLFCHILMFLFYQVISFYVIVYYPLETCLFSNKTERGCVRRGGSNELEGGGVTLIGYIKRKKNKVKQTSKQTK